MLCNACGHDRSAHYGDPNSASSLPYSHCCYGECACSAFVPPGDAAEYITKIPGVEFDAKAAMEHRKALDGATAAMVRGAIDETRELVAALPEELFTLRNQVRAAHALCEAAKDCPLEHVQAARKKFLDVAAPLTPNDK